MSCSVYLWNYLIRRRTSRCERLRESVVVAVVTGGVGVCLRYGCCCCCCCCCVSNDRDAARRQSSLYDAGQLWPHYEHVYIAVIRSSPITTIYTAAVRTSPYNASSISACSPAVVLHELFVFVSLWTAFLCKWKQISTSPLSCEFVSNQNTLQEPPSLKWGALLGWGEDHWRKLPQNTGGAHGPFLSSPLPFPPLPFPSLPFFPLLSPPLRSRASKFS